MRNHEKASNIDVELYFKDLKKLTMKMERLDATKLDYAIVQKQHDQIRRVKDEFEKKYSDLKHFIIWGDLYCQYALVALKAAKEIRDLEEMKIQKVQKENQLIAHKAIDEVFSKEGLYSLGQEQNDNVL